MKFLVRCERIFTILNQGAALERPTFTVTMPRYDSGLPRDTRNCTGIMGNVFERPPAQEGQSSTIFNISENSASSSQDMRPGIPEIARKVREK